MECGAFGHDAGLQARMLVTQVLLGLVYVVLISVAIGAGARTVTVLAIAAGDRARDRGRILRNPASRVRPDRTGRDGAREVSVAEEPELHALVECLCVQADLRKPRLAVVDSTMPNAFALGRSQNAATVCATTGLLTLLEPGELETVLAHEFPHVINRDVMVMTIASFFASIAAVLLRFGIFFVRDATATSKHRSLL